VRARSTIHVHLIRMWMGQQCTYLRLRATGLMSSESTCGVGRVCKEAWEEVLEALSPTRPPARPPARRHVARCCEQKNVPLVERRFGDRDGDRDRDRDRAELSDPESKSSSEYPSDICV